MRTILRIAAATCLTLIAGVSLAAGIEYPETKTVDHVDTYHGTTVADPYRWLEQDVRESAEVAAWVEAQNKVTFAYLESLAQRESIEAQLTKLWDYEKVGTPGKKGGLYFFRKNDGLQNQDVLYVRRSLNDEPRVLIDPNTWSTDGTVALAAYQASPSGRHLAYSVQEAGSDWRTIRVMEIESGTILPDEIRWSKFSGFEWTKDGNGFFYGRYPEPKPGQTYQSLNKNMMVYYHRVGTPQAEDVLTYARPDHPEWSLGFTASEDGNYLVYTIRRSSDDKSQVFVRDLSEPFAATVEIVRDFDNAWSFVGNDGDVLYFRTDLDAPRRRVIALSLSSPDRESWKEVIPETRDTLRGVSYLGGHFVASYLADARSLVRIYRTDGTPVRDVDLGGIGLATGFNGSPDDSETFFSFQSYTTPPTIYRYDVATGQKSVIAQARVAFDPKDFEVTQVFYESKDGTKVPMFLAHRKGLKLNGANPTLLYGYGGFNVAQTPSFSVVRLVWMQMGGVLAVANLRGGGEYGDEWHRAGTKLQKQNVFDDFIAAGEWLVKNKYTRPAKLAVQGGSNGGLLVGAVVNQRPDLFGAALPAVGVMDMLRFHLFTAGRFWTEDYGSSDDPDQFKAIYAYSPYHNVRKGTEYPAVLVTTADHDDRVVPSHSFKYAAAMQAAQAGEAPVLIRIETRAGHGAGKPTSKRIEEAADLWAFLAENLGMKLPNGFRQ
ncbi:MAG: prolyl oligopeptidase family protein [Thermoanaerobaculia bacterium]